MFIIFCSFQFSDEIVQLSIFSIFLCILTIIFVCSSQTHGHLGICFYYAFLLLVSSYSPIFCY